MTKQTKKRLSEAAAWATICLQVVFSILKSFDKVKWEWYQWLSPMLIFVLLIIILVVAVVVCEYISTKCNFWQDEEKWNDRADALAEWLPF